MRHISIFASASLILAACGGGDPDVDQDGEISMEEAQAEFEQSGGVKPEPGLYRVTMEMIEVDIPGAPQGAAEMMKDMMGGQSHTYCLTTDQAEKGFEEMARQSQEDGNCSFDRFEVDGGNINAQMVCNPEGAGTMTMTMMGQGTSTSSVMDMTMVGEMPGMGESTIRMKSNHQRIGDCDA